MLYPSFDGSGQENTGLGMALEIVDQGTRPLVESFLFRLDLLTALEP